MFIAIDGPECSGKTTLIESLKWVYPDAMYIRGLGGSALGERIRAVLMSPNNNLSEETRINLCASSLISTYDELIKVNRVTKLIIVDRWIPSFYSYQDVANHSKAQEYFAQYFDYTLGKIPRPDFTFYLDAPDDTILSRLKDKRHNNNLDELDSYYISNMARINNEYRMFRSLYENDETSQTLDSSNTIKLIMTDAVKKQIDLLLLSN